MHDICRSPVCALNRVKLSFVGAWLVGSQTHYHRGFHNGGICKILMEREYQSSGYGGGGGGGGYDGPHRRPFGRSQSSTEHPTPHGHARKAQIMRKMTILTQKQDLSQTIPLRWCNGCDIGNHDTREEGAWRWRGQAQVTQSMYVAP